MKFSRKQILILILLVVLIFGGVLVVLFFHGAGTKSAEPVKAKHALYLYLCGSTLEYSGGAATQNLSELLEAEIPEDTTVVIETGGSKKWRAYDIPADKICRYTVENGALVLQETLENASMGESSTLRDFLQYCAENYPAEQTGVVLWDHGSGSLDGVCYDLNYNMDSLTLSEMDEAFTEVGERYDFIGFDACLMATYDMASLMAKHADYLIASQEIEPSGGWDYTSLVQDLSAAQDTKTLGTKICDAYLAKCQRAGKDSIATLALLDLSFMDETQTALDDFFQQVQVKALEKYGNFTILTAADHSTKFGGNSKLEGYSNLIDLSNFASEQTETNAASQQLLDALDSLVAYQVRGANRSNAGGISLYYPSVFDQQQLDTYLTLCNSGAYQTY